MNKHFWRLLGLLSCTWGALTSMAHAEGTFAPLTQEMVSSVNKQRQFLAQLVAKNFPGQKLTQSPRDFAILQRIADSNVVGAKQTWELQALGVCFGDALVKFIPGLNWVLVTDEFGTDPTLRYKTSSVQINALTSISKRIEHGEGVEIADFAAQAKEFLANSAKYSGK